MDALQREDVLAVHLGGIGVLPFYVTGINGGLGRRKRYWSNTTVGLEKLVLRLAMSPKQRLVVPIRLFSAARRERIKPSAH